MYLYINVNFTPSLVIPILSFLRHIPLLLFHVILGLRSGAVCTVILNEEVTLKESIYLNIH